MLVWILLLCIMIFFYAPPFSPPPPPTHTHTHTRRPPWNELFVGWWSLCETALSICQLIKLFVCPVDHQNVGFISLGQPLLHYLSLCNQNVCDDGLPSAGLTCKKIGRVKVKSGVRILKKKEKKKRKKEEEKTQKTSLHILLTERFCVVCHRFL